MTPLDFLTSMTPGIKQPEGRFRWTESVFCRFEETATKKFSCSFFADVFIFVVELSDDFSSCAFLKFFLAPLFSSLANVLIPFFNF